jgi:hypothetical protein
MQQGGIETTPRSLKPLFCYRKQRHSPRKFIIENVEFAKFKAVWNKPTPQPIGLKRKGWGTRGRGDVRPNFQGLWAASLRKAGHILPVFATDGLDLWPASAAKCYRTERSIR